MAVLASVAWLVTITPIPETSSLDGHQRGVAFLLDGLARLSLCALVAFAPRIHADLKRSFGMRDAGRVLVVAYLAVGALNAFVQLIRALS